MTHRDDVLLKREYFEAWLEKHTKYQIRLVDQGSTLHVTEALSRLLPLVEQKASKEFIYILVEERPDGRVPAYIGKSKQPLTRWRSHLQKLQQGLGSYARWRDRLLQNDLTLFDLTLYVIGDQQVVSPPIPDFPMTIGAIEYQLIGLAEDAYPFKLLNHEGQSR